VANLRKYKYYFKKPKSEIVKDVFTWLLVGGMVAIATTSPYFVQNLIKGHKKWQKYPKRKVSDTFYRLRKQGFIEIQTVNRQIYISLTKEGRKRAGIFQIDKLKLTKPKRWDRKWRLLMFDVPQKRKIYREALRGKLKELGFLPLQKSVWIYPFECRAEMELLQDFFGLSQNELRLIIAENIGDDSGLRQEFKL
jgi:DNA-binding transcriptional regulator PaaX